MRKPLLAFAASAALALSSHGVSAEIIKIAYIDPFSGPLGFIGANTMQHFRLSEEFARRDKGSDVTIEFTEFDNKMSPQETLLQFKAAVDQGYRYVMQGLGSGPSLALIEAINKHNERNPGKEVIFLNWASADPELTNAKCSYWHFRTDAHAEMRTEAYTTFMASRSDVKRVYLINPNYSFGQNVSLRAKEYLKRKRPDIQIVGDDLIPLGQVKDFSPYIAKIKASGADSVLTANIGPDLSLLVKAAKDGNLGANFFTFYANAVGVASAFGAAPAGRMFLISSWNSNAEAAGREVTEALKKRYNADFTTSSAPATINLLRSAYAKARSIEPLRMAQAMEGLHYKTIYGEVEMRKSDHQLLHPLYISMWNKADGKVVRYDAEGTGYGWQPVKKLDAYLAAQPTSCQMKRPTGG